MKNSLTIGKQAESMALQYLKSKRLQLIERNYSMPYGEIDLIMQDGNTVVFIEVRKRNSSAHGSALETIDVHKQRRLTMTAHSWLQKNTYQGDCRFDVVALGHDNYLKWIKNAFEAVEL